MYCVHRGFPCKIANQTAKRELLIIAHINSLTLFLFTVRACVCVCALLCGNFKAVSIFYRLLCVEQHNDIWIYSACTHFMMRERMSNNNSSSTTKNTNGNKAIEVSSLTDHHHIRKNHLTFQRIPINLNHSKLLLTHAADCVRQYRNIQICCCCVQSATLCARCAADTVDLMWCDVIMLESIGHHYVKKNGYELLSSLSCWNIDFLVIKFLDQQTDFFFLRVVFILRFIMYL